jgi:transcriptional regulator with XRE-family HTH domain
MARGDPRTAPTPLVLFCGRLKRLHLAAGITQTSLAAAAHLGTSQMSDILNGKIKRLPDWEVTAAVVRACLRYAERIGRPVPPDLSDEGDWRRRYGDLEHDLDIEARPRREALAGWPLPDVTDPFALEVHRPVQPDTPQPDLPALPVYVPREHDTDLERVVTEAAQGSSRIAVLVGGSSTGKTRACWEALRLLRDRKPGWRLWHPIDPSRPEAALRDMPLIGPRTVVWLNEAQFYLEVLAGGVGERVAAGLREVLRDPVRAPVLVLATLWPEFWDSLSTRPPAGQLDLHAQARELLAGRDISVPVAFTTAQLQQLSGARDPRLAMAAAASQDGQVIQFLAGAPELLARYRNAPPAAAALISAAIDARRMGMGIALPLAFLEAAAPGYLTDPEWDALNEDWLEQALAYTAAPSKGVCSPLARIRPRPGASTSGLAYRLADFLDQHGRRARRCYMPPADFWAASARFAGPGDLGPLAESADARGLFREAACLRKHAAARGDTKAAASLIGRLHSVHPADHTPLRWAAAHAALDDPAAVAALLNAMRHAGADEQIAALLARDPAANVSLDDPSAVSMLQSALWIAGATDQFTTLHVRAAMQVSVDDPRAVAELVGALREAGAHERANELATRAVMQVSLSHPPVAMLRVLREAGAHDQARVLAARAATQTSLDDPSIVAGLLGALREAGADEQVTALLARDPAAQASLDEPFAVATLLGALREAGADEQVTALLARDPAAHASLDHPHAVGLLLNALREAGAHEQAHVLAARAAADTNLSGAYDVVKLLGVLREAGAHDQVRVLAARAATQKSLNDPWAVAEILDVLRSAGADEQVTALLARDPAAQTSVDSPFAVRRLLVALREAGAHDQAQEWAARVARQAPVDDRWNVSCRLDALRKAGAHDQARELAARAAILASHDPLDAVWLLGALGEEGAHDQVRALAACAVTQTSLDRPWAVKEMLGALGRAGAHDQARALAARVAMTIDLNDPYVVDGMLHALLKAGANEQVTALLARDPATHVSLDSSASVAHLLIALREAGAHDQARELAARAAARTSATSLSLGSLLVALRESGALHQAQDLATRAAAQVPLDDPSDVAMLLYALWEAGASEQVTALLARDPATHVSLGNSAAVAQLLSALREAGAHDQVSSLADRLPAAGLFDLLYEQDNHQVLYRFGRRPDGRPAPSWGWDDLD